MRYFYVLLLLMTQAKFSLAQEVMMLPTDEIGKHIYYEVVKTTVKEDSLRLGLLSFLSKNNKEMKLRYAGEYQPILADGKFVIRKSLAMLSHPSGEITFVFSFETSEDKYRFWLTDFKFIPYLKDRYGNFAPSTTIGKPLETEPKKSDTEQWEEYRLQASKYAFEFANRLKDHLTNKIKSPLPSSEKKVISKTW